MQGFKEGIHACLSRKCFCRTQEEACGLLAPEDHYQHKSTYKFKDRLPVSRIDTYQRRCIHIVSHEHYKSIHPPHISQSFKLLFVCLLGRGVLFICLGLFCPSSYLILVTDITGEKKCATGALKSYPNLHLFQNNVKHHIQQQLKDKFLKIIRNIQPIPFRVKLFGLNYNVTTCSFERKHSLSHCLL